MTDECNVIFLFCCVLQGEKNFEKSMVCRYCYQTEHWEHTCIQKANCNSVASPKAYYRCVWTVSFRSGNMLLLHNTLCGVLFHLLCYFLFQGLIVL